MNQANQTEEELERFRREWREEVTKRAKPQASGATPRTSQSSADAPGSSYHPHFERKAPVPTVPSVAADKHAHLDGADDVESKAYHDLEEKQGGHTLSGKAPTQAKEPVSALDHYEKAVERESQGNLGDSVGLYRKAFKLDARVHEQYKHKHFPPSAFKATKPADTVPVNASSVSDPLKTMPATVSELLEEYSHLPIMGEPAPTELSPAPPCPIASLPEELLVHILEYVAVADVAVFGRLSLVCKRMAFLVMTEENIWKRVALGKEFGFAAMPYKYTRQIDGSELGVDDYVLDDLNVENELAPLLADLTLTGSLVPKMYPTYREMFRKRPRIRFNGCYISTVNYVRPGAPGANQLTWNSPVLIVTYYRYLRFFRDGSVISLLTTSEPSDVVHHLSMEHVHHNHPGGLPSAVMKDALRGRWRLSGPDDGSGVSDEPEGDLHIETQAPVAKYHYKMVLGLANAGKGTRNNKLNWKGYWSHNRLTDDWAEFGLKNDKAFYWSRVKSYGNGL